MLIEPKVRKLDLCFGLSKRVDRIVTNELSLWQVATERTLIIKERKGCEFEVMNSAKVQSTLGVYPNQIPTLIALHSPESEFSKAGPLTRRQAIRLIELYHGLNTIYEHILDISASISDKLTDKRDAIFRRFTDACMSIDFVDPDGTTEDRHLRWNLNSQRVSNKLRSSGFPSFVRLLSIPSSRPAIFQIGDTVLNKNRYEIIRDSRSLQKMESSILAADVCALDAESDSRDPRRAELLGIALSIRPGEAYYLPMIERDLKDISRERLVAALNEIVKKVPIVGQNLKYDLLLLARNGVKPMKPHFDTMLAAYECFGDWEFFNLGFLCKRLLNREIKSYKQLVKDGETFLDLPLKEIADHGCQDADMTLRLYHLLVVEFKNRNIVEQFETRTLSLTENLVNWEFDGIAVNRLRLSKVRDNLLIQLRSMKTVIAESLGCELDLDSNRQVLEAFAERLKLKNSRPISLRQWEELGTHHGEVRAFVFYKRLREILRAVESIGKSAKGNDRIYPLFNQMGAILDLVRLSSLQIPAFLSVELPHRVPLVRFREDA